MIWLRDFVASLTGRIALLLMLGMASASIGSLFVAEHVRILALKHLQLERVVESTVDMAERFDRNPAATQSLLDGRELYGVRNGMAGAVLGPADPHLGAMLTQRMGDQAHVDVRRITSNCFGNMFDARNHIAGQAALPPVDCWQVGFDAYGGGRHVIIVDLPALQIPHNGTLAPTYLLLIVMASALLSFWVARLTAVPLRRLTDAAHRFSLSIDPEAIPVTGPQEVRAALETFNLMQQRVRDGFRERTHILAAIAHDLQTPITRLRLRLEQVKDGPLRDRLIGDLGAMQGLVRDGLDLARSSEAHEDWSLVDIDSLVASMVEDHAEMGDPVTLAGECGVSAWIKPDALTRSLENLVSNAIKYGALAQVSCRMGGEMIEIAVQDAGPGIPPDRMQDMFEPFVRGDTSRSRATGGTGIGLTIARAQARSFGGTITLVNQAQGGLLATLSFPLGAAERPCGGVI
jgi:signal transduction histidine kinase